LIEADRTKLEERMQFTRENYRMMRERLLKIIYWKPEDGGKPPANRDVNEAVKNIVMMDLAILQAEAAAGMYKKPVEALAREFRYDPLTAEVRTIVIAAWKRGGCCRWRRLRGWSRQRLTEKRGRSERALGNRDGNVHAASLGLGRPLYRRGEKTSAIALRSLLKASYPGRTGRFFVGGICQKRRCSS
jgi:hypothetical protein